MCGKKKKHSLLPLKIFSAEHLFLENSGPAFGSRKKSCCSQRRNGQKKDVREYRSFSGRLKIGGISLVYVPEPRIVGKTYVSITAPVPYQNQKTD